MSGPADLMERMSVVFLRLNPENGERAGPVKTTSVSADGSFSRGALDAGRYAVGLSWEVTMTPRPADFERLGLVVVDAQQGGAEGIVVTMTKDLEQICRHNLARASTPSQDDVDVEGVTRNPR